MSEQRDSKTQEVQITEVHINCINIMYDSVKNTVDVLQKLIYK